MPYIGKNPVGGGFHKLDSLTASATDTYALTLGSAAYYPESANQLLVSLNGVIQAPQDSFTVSGSNLVFDTALTASDSIDFVVALGDVLAVQTVTDGAITTAKLGNGAVTDAKIDTMAASKLTGALPAIDGSSLTNVGTVIGTPVSVNGLSSTEYTGLPSDVSAIDITFSGVSNDTSNGYPGIVLGTSSGYETSNYFNNNPYMSSSSQYSGHNTNRSAFVLDSFGAVANNHYFHLRIINNGSNNWIANGHGYTTSGPYNYWYMGQKTLSNTLTKVKIQVATGNFDSGIVNLNYER